MITILENNNYYGFTIKEVIIIKDYIETIKKYIENKHYFILEYYYGNDLRYSFYIQKDDKFVRAFTHYNELQPIPSICFKNGNYTGKYNTKHPIIKIINDIEYVSDNYHPYYINYFTSKTNDFMV